MIKARRIGHATFETPDLEKTIDYYAEFMGLIAAEREKDRAFLMTKIGQLVIALHKADRAHCVRLSFEVAPNSDFSSPGARRIFNAEPSLSMIARWIKFPAGSQTKYWPRNPGSAWS